MTATVFTGTLSGGNNFTYTNNTGGNVRFMIYIMCTGITDGTSAAGTFRFGGEADAGVQWDVFESTNIGKYIANAATDGSDVHGYAHSSAIPVEFMLAAGHTVGLDTIN